MIEEQIDYLKAVEAVVAWVEKNSSWDDTLLILTADHETGLIWGPDSDKTAFEPIVDRGPGNVPGLKYNSSGHSNSLVPLLVRGAGSQQFAKLVVGTDKTAASRFGFSGQYVENTSVFHVMKAAVTGKVGRPFQAVLATQVLRTIRVGWGQAHPRNVRRRESRSTSSTVLLPPRTAACARSSTSCHPIAGRLCRSTRSTRGASAAGLPSPTSSTWTSHICGLPA